MENSSCFTTVKIRQAGVKKNQAGIWGPGYWILKAGLGKDVADAIFPWGMLGVTVLNVCY